MHLMVFTRGRAPRRLLRAILGLLPLLLVISCAQQGGSAANQYPARNFNAPAYAPAQYYPPPGPPDDPWGPYINEAAARYAIPAQWIRAVMAQESGGQEQAVSPAGAMGLMQIMPATYEELREANNLGADPFNPEDNILAGAAYIKEMYARYGAPGFLAAYNAGPDELDAYLAGDGTLPDETVNYLASVAPNLGSGTIMTGPLAAYATGGVQVASAAAPSAASFALGCDVNAAYDPDHPCDAVARTAVVVQAAAQTAPMPNPAAGACNVDAAYNPATPCTAVQGGTGQCDTNLAYDPDSPCTPLTETTAPVLAALPVGSAPASGTGAGSLLYQPAPPPRADAPVPASPPAVAASNGGAWAVQVGAFANPGLARAVAEGARTEANAALANAPIVLPPTTPFGGHVLYRARLVHLSATRAAQACVILNGHQLPCVVVPEASS